MYALLLISFTITVLFGLSVKIIGETVRKLR